MNASSEALSPTVSSQNSSLSPINAESPHMFLDDDGFILVTETSILSGRLGRNFLSLKEGLADKTYHYNFVPRTAL